MVHPTIEDDLGHRGALFDQPQLPKSSHVDARLLLGGLRTTQALDQTLTSQTLVDFVEPHHQIGFEGWWILEQTVDHGSRGISPGWFVLRTS
jgi:hypothetical protein